MLSGKVPSDLDQHEIGWGEAMGQHAMLLDLYAKFQAEAAVYAFFAVLLPGLMVVATHYGWSDRYSKTLLLGAAVVFIAFLTASLHALSWFLWVKRRLDAVYKRMELLGAEMKAGKRPYETL